MSSGSSSERSERARDNNANIPSTAFGSGIDYSLNLSQSPQRTQRAFHYCLIFERKIERHNILKSSGSIALNILYDFGMQSIEFFPFLSLSKEKETSFLCGFVSSVRYIRLFSTFTKSCQTGVIINGYFWDQSLHLAILNQLDLCAFRKRAYF